LIRDPKQGFSKLAGKLAGILHKKFERQISSLSRNDTHTSTNTVTHTSINTVTHTSTNTVTYSRILGPCFHHHAHMEAHVQAHVQDSAVSEDDCAELLYEQILRKYLQIDRMVEWFESTRRS
jgi:hypothetical protein